MPSVHWVPQLVSKLRCALPQLSDVSSDWQDKGLVAYVNVDRDSASRLGITMSDVDNALYNAFGQRLISTIYTRGRISIAWCWNTIPRKRRACRRWITYASPVPMAVWCPSRRLRKSSSAMPR